MILVSQIKSLHLFTYLDHAKVFPRDLKNVVLKSLYKTTSPLLKKEAICNFAIINYSANLQGIY